MTYSDIRYQNCDILSDINSSLLSGIKSDILSDIGSSLLSDIDSDSLSDLNCDILFEIVFDVLSDMDFDRMRSGGEHCHQELAVVVRWGTLPSEACG